MGYLLLSLLLFTSIPAFISNAPGYGLLFGIIVCPLMIFVGRLLFRVRLARPVASGGESEPRSTLDTIGVILVYVFVAFMIVLGLMLAALVIFLIICTINPPRF